jgi:hypothetical protein
MMKPRGTNVKGHSCTLVGSQPRKPCPDSAQQPQSIFTQQDRSMCKPARRNIGDSQDGGPNKDVAARSEVPCGIFG